MKTENGPQYHWHLENMLYDSIDEMRYLPDSLLRYTYKDSKIINKEYAKLENNGFLNCFESGEKVPSQYIRELCDYLQARLKPETVEVIKGHIKNRNFKEEIILEEELYATIEMARLEAIFEKIDAAKWDVLNFNTNPYDAVYKKIKEARDEEKVSEKSRKNENKSLFKENALLLTIFIWAVIVAVFYHFKILTPCITLAAIAVAYIFHINSEIDSHLKTKGAVSADDFTQIYRTCVDPKSFLFFLIYWSMGLMVLWWLSCAFRPDY